MKTDLYRKKISPFPIYIIVIAIAPAITLYANNLTQVAFSSTLRAFAFSLLIPGIIFAILSIILKSIYSSAAIISLGLFLLYIIVPIQLFLIENGITGLSRLRYMIPVFIVIFILGLFVILKKIRNPILITKPLNIISLVMILFPLYQLGAYWINSLYAKNIQGQGQVETLQEAPVDRMLPDVYYIVLDTHGRSDKIYNELNYDNSQFLDKLSQTGFYVAQCSNANYPSATWQSMYATLNMQFFNHEKIGNQSPIQTSIDGVSAIKNNEVVRQFKRFGYKYVSFNTLYDFLNFTNADVYLDLAYIPDTKIKLPNKFESLLIASTPLSFALNGWLYSNNEAHYKNVVSIMDELPKISTQISSPKFVYAHIMVPHYPYVFSPTGNYMTDDSTGEFLEDRYVDQVAYIDAQIVTITEKIIENSPTPPIIIVQGDHGFPSADYDNSAGILNAYYFPGVEQSDYLYPSISPINTFRLIFNVYFGLDMPLLPDTIYRDNLESDAEHNKGNIPYLFTEYVPRSECSISK